MVRCDTDYIPLWPFFYHKNSISKQRLHILWPLITFFKSSTSSVFALFYIVLRVVTHGSTFYFDILWPIIHYEYDEREEEARFSIRPLMWIINGTNKFHFVLLGIIHYKYDDGDIWFVIAPFIWFRRKRSKSYFMIPPILWVVTDSHNDAVKILILPVGSFFSSSSGWTLNLLLLFTLKRTSSMTLFMLIPFLFVRVKSSSFSINLIGLIHYHYADTDSFYWFILPFIYHIRNGSYTRFMILPLIYYTRGSSFKNLNILGFYHYYSGSVKFVMFLLLFFYYSNPSGKTFLNILALYNYSKSNGSKKKRYILFPFLWIRVKPEENFTFHLWPAFGWKTSQKSHGYNIYFLYPAIIYKNKESGRFIHFNILYRFIHYSADTFEKLSSALLLPVFGYSNFNGVDKGFVLLYFWYYRIDRYKIKTPKPEEIIISTPNSTSSNEVEMIGSINSTPGEESSESENNASDSLPNSKYSLRVNGLVPLVFYGDNGYEKKLMILPLFIWVWSYASKSYSSKFISLIYYHCIREEFTKRWLLPIFYQKRISEDLYIVSLLFFRIKRGTTSFTLLFPLFIDLVKGESHLTVVLFPTMIHYRKSIFKFTTIFPFFFQTQDASKGDYFVYYFPIFGSSSEGSKTKKIYFFFPLFSYKHNSELDLSILDILFPLFHYERSQISSSLRFLPFFWRSKNDYNEFLLIMPFYWRFVTNKDTRAQSNTLIFPFYFKRDSAEYLFTFASPVFLPPYYVHYHREASQVENTYLFPFFAHKIKGLDHLRWFLLILYRHTWRDFSETYAMNVLLYFSRNNEKSKSSGLLPLWVQWFDKESEKYHLRILLLLAYDKMKTEALKKTHIALLWIVSSRVSLFSHYRQKETQLKEDDTRKVIKYRKTYLFPIFRSVSSSEGEFSLSLIWFVKPYLSFFYRFKNSEESYVHLLLLYYRQVTQVSSLTSIIWFAHPIVSIFLREITVFSTITRLFPLFYNIQTSASSSKMQEDSLSDAAHRSGNRQFTLLYVYPGYGVFNYKSKLEGLENYFLLLYYYKRKSDQISLSFIWLIKNFISLYYTHRSLTLNTTRLFPIFYIQRDETRVQFSLIWFVHPFVSFIRYSKSSSSQVFSIFPILWTKKTSGQLEVSIIYLVTRYGFISYLRSTDEFRFYIFLMIWIQRFKEEFLFSLCFIVSPKAALWRVHSKNNYTKSFLFLVYYYKLKGDTKRFSLMWLIRPEISFITYYSQGNMFRFYILLALWISGIDGYHQYGLFWIAPKKWDIYRNSSIHNTSHTRHILIPISLFLWLNDGESIALHLLPLFRYTNDRTENTEVFWTLFGGIYFKSQNGDPDFRFLWRLFRVHSKTSYFFIEINPFFSYKKKAHESRVLILGGCSGCYRKSSGFNARVCCIEC